MLLSNRFLNVVDKTLQERLNQKLFHELSDLFPEQLDPGKEAAGTQDVAAQRKEAAKKGIIIEKAAFQWLALHYLLGADFFDDTPWQQYITAAGRTVEYALDCFVSAVATGIGMSADEKNGYGLAEAAYDALPAAATAAVTKIKAELRMKQLVGILLATPQFLITPPSAITQNPYNAKIASLNTEISASEEQARKAGLPARDMRLREFAILIENDALKKVAETAGEEGKDGQAERDKINANEQELGTLKEKLAKEEERTMDQIQKLTEKVKALTRELELFKATRK